MISELQAASKQLESALERYNVALSMILGSYNPLDRLSALSRAMHTTMPAELERIFLYEARIKHAKALARQTINLIPSISSINSLPVDVLNRIFELLTVTQPYHTELPGSLTTSFVQYPEAITSTCSLWRRIAINSCKLWTHIDLHTRCLENTKRYSRAYLNAYPKRLLARAEIFRSRAGSMHLDINLDIYLFSNTRVDDLSRSWASIAAQTSRLEIEASLPNVDSRVPSHFIASCTPGRLKDLLIHGYNWMRNRTSYFIEAADQPIQDSSLLLDIPHALLEDILSHVSVLCLSQCFFHWTSRVYSGLVELRLMRTDRAGIQHITRSQILKIFSSSPRLRILQFGLQIADPHTSSDSVSLPELEILNLRSLDSNQCEGFLQLISPGSKELQLLRCVRYSQTASPMGRPFGPQFKAFFSRSNVTELVIEFQSLHRQSLLGVLSSLPLSGVQALCLCRANLQLDHHPLLPLPTDEVFLSPSTYGNPELHPRSPQLHTLYLADCTFEASNIRQACQSFPIKEIIFADCSLRVERKGKPHQIRESWQIRSELARALHAVKIRDVSSADLWRGWDVWVQKV